MQCLYELLRDLCYTKRTNMNQGQKKGTKLLLIIFIVAAR